jgi:tetratricopeptide (TPR) repeat protein
MFRQNPPAAGWGYILASTKENRVGSLELSNKQVVVRESEGEYHVQTNHYLTPELRGKNLLINTSVAEDNDGRYIRIKQRLEEARSRVDVEEAISILGDQVDPYVNQPRGIGSTVGVHTTMTSLVIEPAQGRVFVAAGRAPVPHGPYVELPLVGAASPDTFATDSSRVLENRSFREAHPQMSAAEQLFIEAKAAYEYKNDFQRTFQLLAEVVRVDDTNPAYYFQLGIFALKCRMQEKAITAFGNVFDRPYVTPQLKRLAHYYRGRALAHLSRREAALADFAAVLEDAGADNKLKNAALWASRSTSLFGSCTLRQRSLNIMMQQSDMLHY